MTDASTEVIDALNELAEKRFLVELERNKVNEEHKSAVAELEAQHQGVLAGFDSEIQKLDTEISQLIQANRKTLIARGKKSFVIMRAKFQFRGPKPGSKPKTKVTNANGVMEVARRLGVVRKIAKPAYVWKLNQEKFLSWLEQHGEMRSKFEPYIDETKVQESLTMQPNSNYTVHHDSKRVSPPSVSIKLS